MAKVTSILILLSPKPLPFPFSGHFSEKKAVEAELGLRVDYIMLLTVISSDNSTVLSSLHSESILVLSKEGVYFKALTVISISRYQYMFQYKKSKSLRK